MIIGKEYSSFNKWLFLIMVDQGDSIKKLILSYKRVHQMTFKAKNIYFLAKSLSWVTICPSVIPRHGNLTNVKGPNVSLLHIWLEDTSTWFIVRHNGTGVGQIGAELGSSQNQKFTYKLIETVVNYRFFLCKRFHHSVWNPGLRLTRWLRLQSSNNLKWYNSHLVLTSYTNRSRNKT